MIKVLVGMRCWLSQVSPQHLPAYVYSLS